MKKEYWKKNSLVVILKFFRANLNYFDSDSGFKFEIIFE